MLDFLFSSASRSLIRLVPVNLGPRSVGIPVAVIRGSRPGKTLLVTGGTDGDEYAGMEAAYAIAERFKGGDFAGTLLVVPVVNVPGFQAECSRNPMDQKFPKFVFPGRADGMPTERLMHWLVSGYATGADAWMDLHGGAITEGVRPFLWLFESGEEATDSLARRFVGAADVETVVLEKVSRSSKAGTLAGEGCLYVLAESGCLGGRAAEDVERHVGWTVALMEAMGMVESQTKKPRESQPRMLRRAAIVSAPFEGIWRPADLSGLEVRTGTRLGTCVRLDGTDAREILAPASGIPLWWKQSMSMRQGDELMAIGTV